MDSFNAYGAQYSDMQYQQRGGSGQSGANVCVEEYSVPDKMVGLIIGRGGERITRLQAESGCRVQISLNSGGTPDRLCTLTGSRQNIMKAKDMLNSIISRGNSSSSYSSENNHVQEGRSVAEIMIPGSKVGLVIGRGGETIRNLQERAGVKMVLIQDSPQQTSRDKPLRITGDSQNIEFAKQMIVDLINEKK